MLLCPFWTCFVLESLAHLGQSVKLVAMFAIIYFVCCDIRATNAIPRVSVRSFCLGSLGASKKSRNTQRGAQDQSNTCHANQGYERMVDKIGHRDHHRGQNGRDEEDRDS